VEIVEIDVGGKSDGDSIDDVADEGGVLENDVLFERRWNLVVLDLGLA